MKMDSSKMVNVIGVAGALLSIGATLLTSYSDGKKLDARIEDTVNKELIKRLAELGMNQEG